MQGLSPYIYGIHDRGGERLLAGKGQVLVTESIGADPNSVQGADYSDLARQGLGVIVRLNYSHHGQGTIPTGDKYAAFAQTCARFVAQSRGCVIWIIGNEPNHPVERPQGQPITPQDYAACFRLCRDAIKQVGGQHQVLPAAVGPWNAETKYPGNESGDWVQYFADMLNLLGECDGLTLHAYTRGASPAMVHSERRMDAPFQHRHASFRVYQDFLHAVPAPMRHLPVLITEIDEYDAWVDADIGVVQAIYQEIDAWNRSGGQPIVAGILYRWLNHDQWGFQDKPGVHADLRAAIAQGYRAPQVVAAVGQQPKQSHEVYIPMVQVNHAQNRQPPQRVWDERLDRRFASLHPAVNDDGGPYWKLVRAEWLDERQAQGRHHVFVDVLDAQGQRIVGVPVRFWWADGQDIKRSEAKPGEHYAVDFALYNPAPAYNVAIADGKPSDAVHGLGLGSIEQPKWNIHTSYRLVWQVAAAEPPPQTPQNRTESDETDVLGPTTPSDEKTSPERRYAVFGDRSPEDWLISALARVVGVEPRLARAFVQVESGGYGLVNGRLVIRFEAHIFRQQLGNDAWFAQHFRYNEAEPWKDQQWRRTVQEAWQPVHVDGSFEQRQAAEWAAFDFAASINRHAALRSISMGRGQIMGFNHGTVGYPSPEAMFDGYSASELNQLVGLFAYCHNTRGLVEAMQRKDWWTMALLYNGSGQVAYYAAELQRVYQELGG